MSWSLRITAEGQGAIRKLVERARGCGVTVLAAGGLSEFNAVELVRYTGVSEVHGSLRAAVPCKTQFRKSGVYVQAPLTYVALAHVPVAACRSAASPNPVRTDCVAQQHRGVAWRVRGSGHAAMEYVVTCRACHPSI